MNLLSLIAILYSLEAGYSSGGFLLWNYNPEKADLIKSKTLYTNLGVKIKVWSFYIGGSIETPVQHISNGAFNMGSFNPIKENYSFDAGFKRKWFELGYQHFCTHPMTAYVPNSFIDYKFEGSYDRVFIKIEHEFHPFK